MSIPASTHHLSSQPGADTPLSSTPVGSPNRAKGRSESSPAKLISGTAPSVSLMSATERRVPPLNLTLALTDAGPDASLKSATKLPLQSSDPSVRSVGSSSAPASPPAQVRFAPSSAQVGSASPTSTPRAKSVFSVAEARSPRRHQIDNSPRKSIDKSKRVIDGPQEISASPRKIDERLITLGTEVARLVFAEMRAANPLLGKATIDQLGRFETMIAIDQLSPALRALVPDGAAGRISHARLIKAVFLPLLSDGEVGKTLLAMRLSAMEQYDGSRLTLVDREMREAEDPGFKSRLQANIEGHGSACADVALGLKQVGLPASRLPQELISFWKTMDKELCNWAAGNPDLPAAELKKARANLGFDLLFTRLILPMASGPKEEAGLAIPSMFFESVKRALLVRWPAFVDNFTSTVDRDRRLAAAAAASIAASSSTTRSATTTTSSATTTTTSASTTTSATTSSTSNPQ